MGTMEAFDKYIYSAAHAFSYGMGLDEVVDMLAPSTDSEGDAYLIAKAARLFEEWFNVEASD